MESDPPRSLKNLTIRTVLFDLDNTLLDRDDGITRFAHEIYRSSKAIRQAHSESDAVEFVHSLDGGGGAAQGGLLDRHDAAVAWGVSRPRSGGGPENDAVGARGLGISTAWVHYGRLWPHDGAGPDYTIGHVSEVRDIVFA